MGPAALLAAPVSMASSSVAATIVTLINGNFKYEKLDKEVKEILEDDNNKIKICYIFESPLKMSKSPNPESDEDAQKTSGLARLISHKEVILKIETSHILFSFGIDGLEHGIGSLEKLANRRKNNEEVFKKNLNTSVKHLRNFLQNVSNKSYDLLAWNCLSFTSEMIASIRSLT